MNIIRVYGGLGNQLFQYALGKAQEANGIEVKYDLSWFKKPQIFPRPYRLDMFQTKVVVGTRSSTKLKERGLFSDSFKIGWGQRVGRSGSPCQKT